MLRFNLNGVSNDTYELLKLVVVERFRFRKELISFGGFDKKLENVTHDMLEEFCNTIVEDYNTIDELLESETLVLIFTWLLEEAIHYISHDELTEWIMNGLDLLNSIRYCMSDDLLTIFEEVEEDEEQC